MNIEPLKISWRKGENYPTASQLNSIVYKINELVRNGATASVNTAGDSFDWKTIPSVSLSSRGLMTPEMYSVLVRNSSPSIDTLVEIIGDYYVRTEYVLTGDEDYTTSNSPVSAGYVATHFVNRVTYNTFVEEYNEFVKDLEKWKQDVPTLDANNTFTGYNTFDNEVILKGGFVVDNVEVGNIQKSDEAPSSSDSSLVTDKHVSTYYLRKDKGEWSALGDYRFDDNGEYFRINKDKVTFTHLETYGAIDPLNDFFGSGVLITNDAVGNGYVYTDELHVRKTTWLRNVTIEETKHIGGETILSSAYCVIEIVVPITIGDKSYFVCFFAKEANGKAAYQMWEKGDQAMLRQTSSQNDGINTRYYWRVVTECGDGTDIGKVYPTLTATLGEESDPNGTSKLFGSWCDDYFFVVLSNNQIEDLGEGYSGHGATHQVQMVGLAGFDEGSCDPLENDEIVLFGNRNLDPSRNYRRAAQLYSTMQENSPLRKYYTGIGIYNEIVAVGEYKFQVFYPFSFKNAEIETMEYTENDGSHWEVGKGDNFIRFTEAGGLEASLTSLSIIAGGKSTSVTEALGNSFRIWTREIEWYASDFGIPKTISWDKVFPSNEWIDEKDRLSHNGDNLVTMDGFSYEFYDDVWTLTTDQYLVYANKIASEAQESLFNIADDNIITRQEKGRLRQILQEINAEYENVSSESSEMVDADYVAAYTMLRNFILTILNEKADFYLEENGLVWMVNHDGNVIKTTPDSEGYTFEECYSFYYEQRSYLRRLITASMVKQIGDATSKLETKIGEDISGLADDIGNTNNALLKLDDDLAALAKGLKENGAEYVSGFVTNAEYAAMETNLYALDEKGNFVLNENGDKITIASALASTFIYVVDGKAVSGFMIKADRIQFDGNVGMQGLTYRVPSTPKGYENNERVYKGFLEAPVVEPTDVHAYDFYAVDVLLNGLLNVPSNMVGMYAFNLAKTGSFIELNYGVFENDAAYFLLPCVVSRDSVMNRYKFEDNTNERTIINFFRKEAYKYLGNTMVIKVPPRFSVQFEASEFTQDAMPLLVSRGVSIPQPTSDYNYEYNGEEQINTESAWIASSDTKTRYIVLTSKAMRPSTIYRSGVVTKKTNVLGWEIAVFDDEFKILK